MKRREMLVGAAVTGAAGIATMAALTQSVPALAQATPPLTAGGVLDRIIKEKKIRVTAEVTSPPFGILDRNNQPDGSEIETARQLARISVSNWNRAGHGPPTFRAACRAADVAISSLSITFDRAKTVMFAPPHGTVDRDRRSKKTPITRRPIWQAEDRHYGRPRGSDRAKNHRPARIVFFDDIAATLQAMVSGQVDAAGMSAFAAKSVADRNPKAEIENKFTVTTAFYAAAVRPGDFDLLQFLRTWVFLNKNNGVLAGIYKKYTEVALIDLPVL